MYIDTHCHLNFKRFEKKVDEVIRQALNNNVTHIIIPGTDYVTSIKALDIANENNNIYASVGIHPHHITDIKYEDKNIRESEINKIEKLLEYKKVVALGEIGLDRHTYEISKYGKVKITEDNINLQKEILISQINLALEFNKSVILHNREAEKNLINLLSSIWDKRLENKTVFHCCEPKDILLDFAIKNKIFIGVDGDVTYDKEKIDFVNKIPLNLLVLETDSPYLLPEPLRSQKKYPNVPSNIPIIAKQIANIKNIHIDEIAKITSENAYKLFSLD